MVRVYTVFRMPYGIFQINYEGFTLVRPLGELRQISFE